MYLLVFATLSRDSYLFNLVRIPYMYDTDCGMEESMVAFQIYKNEQWLRANVCLTN